MNATLGVAIATGVIAFSTGFLVATRIRVGQSAAQVKLTEMQRSELRRLRRQRRAVLEVCDRGSDGEWRYHGLASVAAIREAVGASPTRIRRPEFGRGNDITTGDDDGPPTTVIGP